MRHTINKRGLAIDPSKTLRILKLITLSILITMLSLMLLNSSIQGYCDTTNDLREELGVETRQLDENIAALILKEYTNNENKDSELVDNNNEKETDTAKIIRIISSDNSENSEILEARANVENIKDTIKQRLNNYSTAYTLVRTVNSLMDANAKLNVALSKVTTDVAKDSISYINMVSRIPSNLTGNESSVYESTNITGSKFEIGDINDDAISPVQHYFEITIPYGYTKDVRDEKYTNSKLLGMDLYAPVGEYIVSQWNGVVTDIRTDFTGRTSTIEIYHSNGLYTYYSLVEPVSDLFIGEYVQEGQVIAKAVDTSFLKTGEENHIYYQITLDDEYINPLTIFGNRGKQAYEEWFDTTTLVNAVDVGEKLFNTKEYDPYETVKESYNIPDVQYYDFNTEEPERIEREPLPDEFYERLGIMYQ
ncbi:MAG: M23 family metallopeptidase [Lachnospiraceae bacterium]|nr:M23 family metallopeptidase [Lachnospiraceae bacterium]